MTHLTSISRWFPLALTGLPFAGCTVEAPDADEPDPVSTVDSTSFASCVATGGQLFEDWSVNNGHGVARTAAHSSQGLSVIGSEDGILKTWAVASGELTGSFGGGAGGFYGDEFGAGSLPASVAFDAAGEALVVGFDDGSVHLIDPISGVTSSTLTAAAAPVRSVAIDINGGAIAFADNGFAGSPGVWDGVGTTTTLQTELWGVSKVGFRATDGALILSGHWYGVPALDLRQAGSPEVSVGWWMAPTDGEIGMSGGAVADFVVADDGATVLGVGDGFVMELDLTALLAGEEIVRSGTLAGHDAVAAVAVPGGTLLATVGNEGRIVLWNRSTLTPVSELAGGAALSVSWDAGTGRLVVVQADGLLRLVGCGG